MRSQELGQLRRMIPMRVGMQTLLYAAPVISMVVCFAVYGTTNPQDFTAASEKGTPVTRICLFVCVCVCVWWWWGGRG